MTDPHSRYRPEHPRLVHLDLRFEVDFERQRIEASAELRFAAGGPAPVVLDTRDIEVASVRSATGPVEFALTDPDPILGTGLAFELPDGVDTVTIDYRTSPAAAALQWLEPEQTAGKKLRYLYSQSQSINSRSFIPVQDTMGTRVTYSAQVDVPAGYVVRMSAEATGVDELADGRRRFHFAAPRAMTPYLIAIAVGDLASRRVGPRSTIWAEPVQLDAAAAEFEDLDAMLLALEQLYGPYRWSTADLLVMPPTYPLGGMEHPQLTYAASTLVAGDKSAVNVVAHEIAHHWSGNLVSGESLEHFWINEGPTVYGEWRIVEQLYGRDDAELMAAVERTDLEANLDDLADQPEETRLRRHLEGIDPEANFSLVAHLKGFLFVRAIEEAVGRDRFDPVFRQFFEDFAFQTVSTEQFVEWIEPRLPGAVDWNEWLSGEGLPASAPRPFSPLIDEIRRLGDQVPSDDLAARLGPLGWQVYLSRADLTLAQVQQLEDTFHVSAMPNPDIRRHWLETALTAGWAPAIPAALDLVRTVGRMKYLMPIYAALAQRDPDLAASTYRANRGWYHPLARSALDTRFPA